MSSKLDPFFSKLFELLSEQGLSYQSVCSYLAIEGVKISPQALRSWYLRRNRKLMLRSQLRRPQQDFDLEKLVFKTGRAVESIEGRSLVNEVRTNGVLVGDVHKKLEMQIQEEEKRLTSGIPFGQKGFLIKKKETCSTNTEVEKKTSIS